MDERGVEFVSGDPAPAGERADVLEVGRPRATVARWVFLALVAAAAVAAWLLRGSGTSAQHRPTATHGAAPTAIRSPGFPCPGPGVCVTSSTVPRAVAAAVARYVPHAATAAVRSALREGATAGNPLLQAREIEAHLGSNTLLIRVRPYYRPVPSVAISPTPPGLASAVVHLETPGYVVDLQWIGEDDTIVPMAALRALAADRRLETVS